nr:DIS3-like exonuclease 2 isoform X1 [Dermacentor andersoni]
MESGKGSQELALDSGQTSTAAALLKDGLGQLSLGPADPGAQPAEASAPAAVATSKGKGAKKGQGKNAKAKRQQLCLATCERGRLSLSDPSNLRANASSAATAARSPLAGRHTSVPVSASPSSSSSGAASWGPTRDRAASDPRRGGGSALLPPALKAQHAAHRCKRKGGGPPPGSRSESGSSPLASSHLRRSPCSPSSAATLSEGSFPSSRRSSETHLASPAFASQRQKPKDRATKYEAYMPLCEVQQALKKGEVVEGVLRINPRNYEDSFISAPDSQMDIYIGGLHDRNRALNGDLVAVKIKPQEEWKILWDRMHLWEQKTGQSIHDALSGNNSTSGGGSPVEDDSLFEEDGVEVDGGELPESSVPPATTWDGSSPTPGAPRPSDTIEVLGIERLLGQVQEYVQKQRRNGKSHRKSGGPRPGRLPMPCSLEASLAPLPSALVATTLGGDRLPAPTAPQPEPQPEPEQEQEVITVDPWAETEDLGSTMVFSPEELLEVPEQERHHHSSSPPLRGRAVAPDELSGEDDWSSDAESTGSGALEQHLEDMAFLQASLDARNNNEQQQDGSAPSGRAGESVAERIGRSLNSVAASKVDGISVPPLPGPALEQQPPDSKSVAAVSGWGPLTWGLSPSGDQEGLKEKPAAPATSVLPHAAQVAAVQVEPAVEECCLVSSRKAERRTGDNKHRRRRSLKKGKKKQGPAAMRRGQGSTRAAKGQYEGLTVSDILQHPLAKRFVQRTGEVVHILEAKNSRVTAGLLRQLQDHNPAWVLFSPRDARFPRLMVPAQECPPGFFQRPADFTHTLFLAELVKWLPDATFPMGKIRRLLGPAGSLAVETNAMLESYDVDHQDFPPDILDDLGVSSDWKVPEEELSGRRDFRDELVFTVDPKTARDLDDAISCRRLVVPEGDQQELWEVGVHIADVSRFVQPGTQLDQVARKRATSVYLVERVIPMLPRLLCDNLCSLHPGEDKLTVSVVWTLTSDGRVLSEWFGRSIIRSCCKLSYEHAQDLLDDPDRERAPGELPDVIGKHTVAEMAECLRVLRGMTESMRKRRFSGGALRLDQVKVVFSLGENFQPYGFSVYEHTESHRLIEELMLLANMAVAHRLYKAFPEEAFLRSHPPPDDAQLVEVEALCSAHGVNLDTTSAGTLQASLNALVGTDDELSRAKLNVLTHLLSKPMKMAVYFCAGRREDPFSFAHYALNVPLYTHFTSPIRRYADIVVHRQLAAALGCGPPVTWTASELQSVADHCNDNKYKARTVQELSTDLFLHAFVEQCGSLEDRAMVTAVLEHAFDVLALSVGMIKRVYCDKLGVKEFSHSTEGGRSAIELRYQSSRSADEVVVVNIGVFQLVDVLITVVPKEPLKYQVVLKLPPYTVPVVPAKKEDKDRRHQKR